MEADVELQRLYAALDEALAHRMGPPTCPSVEQVQKCFTAKVVGVSVEGDNLVITLEMPPIKYISMSFTVPEEDGERVRST